MNLNDEQNELKILSDLYDLTYETRNIPSILSDSTEEHIWMWVPYNVCEEILPLLTKASGIEWDDNCKAILGTDSLCIDLNEMFAAADLDYEFIQALSGIKLKNCEVSKWREY